MLIDLDKINLVFLDIRSLILCKVDILNSKNESPKEKVENLMGKFDESFFFFLESGNSCKVEEHYFVSCLNLKVKTP